MAISQAASTAIQAAAAQALASTPSSMLQPYLPQGPINARALGAIAWMKQSGKLADLAVVVVLCNTLESMLSDPKRLAELVDANNAKQQVLDADPLDLAQANYADPAHAAWRDALLRQAGIASKLDKAEAARYLGGDDLLKSAFLAGRAARQEALDEFVAKRHEAAGTKRSTPAPQAAHSASNPTVFGRI